MPSEPQNGPESTAARVALWRAMHTRVDAPPFIVDDQIGFQLIAPDSHWMSRPDMDVERTKLFRASIVARARFLDDLVIEQAGRGVDQYVILGAGLDSFAQRHTHVTAQLKIFEVDQPAPQIWKQKRLKELGLSVPTTLTFVPVNFEAGVSWWETLVKSGFQVRKPAVVASTGVSMYLTREAIQAMLKQIATMVPGSTLAMSYLIPLEMATAEERPGREAAERGARMSGTPFLSFFTSKEIISLAREAGFKEAKIVTAADLANRYFRGRSDGLRTSGSEEILIAAT